MIRYPSLLRLLQRRLSNAVFGFTCLPFFDGARTLFYPGNRVRATLALALGGWALVCLTSGPFMAQGSSYIALRWMPQPDWGVLGLLAALGLIFSMPGRARGIAGAVSALVLLWLSLSFAWSSMLNHTGINTGPPVYLALCWASLMVVRDGAR